MRESCSPSKTKSDQSAICSLPCTELSRCNPSLVVSRCSSGRQGSGMKCRNNSLHSTKKNPSRFSHTGCGEESSACSSFYFGEIRGGQKTENTNSILCL